MTRFAYAAAESASGLSTLQYRTLVEVGVTSSTVYACNGTKYIFALGNTYTPVGGFGGIEAVGEDPGGTPRTLRLWLQAATSADLYEPMREDMFNRTVTVRRMFIDVTSNTQVSTPEKLWGGFVNKVDVHFADEERGNFFEIEAESAARRKAEAMNYTRETLQTVLSQSGDTFFDYIHQVPLSKALWGDNPIGFAGIIRTFFDVRGGGSAPGGGWQPK